MNSAVPVVSSRAVRIGKELCGAISAMDSVELRTWAVASAARIDPLLARRGRSLAGLGKAIAEGVGEQAFAAWATLSRRDDAASLWRRWSATGRSKARGSPRAGNRDIDWLAGLLRDRRATAGELVTILAARGIASAAGAAEDNATDLRLLSASGRPQPPVAQSTYPGIALEALLMALSSLAHVLHGHLPEQRDPAWDALDARSAHLADLAGRCQAAGVAWHLFVDAFVQPAALHGGIVPDLPMTLHQGLATVDAAAETNEGLGDAEQRGAIQGETPDQRENDMMRRWMGTAVEP